MKVHKIILNANFEVCFTKKIGTDKSRTLKIIMTLCHPQIVFLANLKCINFLDDYVKQQEVFNYFFSVELQERVDCTNLEDSVYIRVVDQIYSPGSHISHIYLHKVHRFST